MTDSPPNDPVLALLGTGAMGVPMARHLCQAGFAVHVWNRTANKAHGLAELDHSGLFVELARRNGVG